MTPGTCLVLCDYRLGGAARRKVEKSFKSKDFSSLGYRNVLSEFNGNLLI